MECKKTTDVAINNFKDDMAVDIIEPDTEIRSSKLKTW